MQRQEYGSTSATLLAVYDTNMAALKQELLSVLASSRPCCIKRPLSTLSSAASTDGCDNLALNAFQQMTGFVWATLSAHPTGLCSAVTWQGRLCRWHEGREGVEGVEGKAITVRADGYDCEYLKSCSLMNANGTGASASCA